MHYLYQQEIIMATGKSEARIQQECWIWFNNTYPHLRGCLFAVPNGTATSSQQGKLMKETGTYRGVSDLLLMYQGRTTCLELKTLSGYQSVHQRDWQLTIEKQGFEYHIVRSLAEFQRIIKSIIS